ncbi:MAG: acyltransferase family protein, partial [Arthrobacter sp.]
MESKQEKKRDGALDGLRGLAALAVLWNHLGLERVGGVTAPTWTLWLADGTAAVMIFFVLSGYVIGLTTPFAAGPKDVGRYARKRVLRLLPLNLVGVLLACL